MKKSILILSAATLMISCGGKVEKVTISHMFSDNMVLQQNAEVPVWGTAGYGQKVEVQFGNNKATARADKNGRWQANLRNLQLGEPDSLIITSANQRIVFRNVQVGEVWLCSGQSNMEMPMISNWSFLNNREQECREANYPNIRYIKIERNIATRPIDTVITSGWKECDSITVRDLSCTAYFFARCLHKDLNVPIGLVFSSWGGTTIETWMSQTALDTIGEFEAKMQKLALLPIERDSLDAIYERDLAQMNREKAELDAGISGGDTIFLKTDFDRSGCVIMNLPSYWESTEIGSFDGTMWFSRDVEIPTAVAGKELIFNFGSPDDAADLWVNGIKIKQDNFDWGKPRFAKIPSGITKAGKNTIVFLVTDNQGSGGWMNEKSDYYLTDGKRWKMNVADGWAIKKGYELNQIKTQPIALDFPSFPCLLYNGMINPLIPFAIKGAIWYQGESNADRAYQYNYLFKAMITDWRQKWGIGDFPFLFCQLANYMDRNAEPVDDTWAELREAQSNALSLPNTGMAVLIDIGNPKDIHPGNKQAVGMRLANIAENDVYNLENECNSPIIKNWKIDGNKIILEFDFAYSGLSTLEGKAPIGFAIAGADNKFVWAKAEVIGNTATVWADGIAEPKNVRYGWSANPEVNVINSAGLPMNPFRTDTLHGITYKKY